MQHIGTLFVSKHRPLASVVDSGTFQLQLFAVDRIGAHQVEPWRLLWTGPEAQVFWETHSDALLAPGTPLRITAHKGRAHQCGRAGAEFVAHVITCEIAPQRTFDKREALSA